MMQALAPSDFQEFVGSRAPKSDWWNLDNAASLDLDEVLALLEDPVPPGAVDSPSDIADLTGLVPPASADLTGSSSVSRGSGGEHLPDLTNTIKFETRQSSGSYDGEPGARPGPGTLTDSGSLELNDSANIQELQTGGGLGTRNSFSSGTKRPDSLGVSAPPVKAKGTGAKRGPKPGLRKNNVKDLQEVLEQQMRVLMQLQLQNDELQVQARVMEEMLKERDNRIATLAVLGPPQRSWQPISITANRTNTYASSAPATTLAAIDAEAGPSTGWSDCAECAREGRRACDTHGCQGCLEVMARYRGITIEQFAERYRGYVKACTNLLLQVDGLAAPPAELLQQIEWLSMQTGVMLGSTASVNIPVVLRVHATNFETMGMEGPQAEYWPRVLAALQLTEMQQREFKALYSVCLGAYHRLWGEHGPLAAELRAQLALSESLQCRSREGDNQEVAVKRLDKNLNQQYNVHCMLCSNFFKKLDALQFARAAVHAYPYFPCAMSMCNVLYHGGVYKPMSPFEAPDGGSWHSSIRGLMGPSSWGSTRF